MPDFYGSAAGFSTYHTDRGRDVASYAAPGIEAALLVASEWLDARHRSSFGGLKVGQRDQVREWPRTGALDVYGYAVSSETTPTEIENATYEAALRELEDTGSLSVDWTPPKYKRAAVDGAVNVEYVMHQSAMDVQTRFAVIDEILSPILTGRGNISSLSGSIVRA